MVAAENPYAEGKGDITFPASLRHTARYPADLEALEDTLVRVSYLAMHLEGHLAELDINPLMVLPRAQGVKAVDALVVFCGT